jgi:hypothetical protein
VNALDLIQNKLILLLYVFNEMTSGQQNVDIGLLLILVQNRPDTLIKALKDNLVNKKSILKQEADRIDFLLNKVLFIENLIHERKRLTEDKIIELKSELHDLFMEVKLLTEKSPNSSIARAGMALKRFFPDSNHTDYDGYSLFKALLKDGVGIQDTVFHPITRVSSEPEERIDQIIDDIIYQYQIDVAPAIQSVQRRYISITSPAAAAAAAAAAEAAAAVAAVVTATKTAVNARAAEKNAAALAITAGLAEISARSKATALEAAAIAAKEEAAVAIKTAVEARAEAVTMAAESRAATAKEAASVKAAVAAKAKAAAKAEEAAAVKAEEAAAVKAAVAAKAQEAANAKEKYVTNDDATGAASTISSYL